MERPLGHVLPISNVEPYTENCGTCSTFGGEYGEREAELSKGEMRTNSKESRDVARKLFNALGFLSFLFGSLVLLAIAFGTIGGIFMSTKWLFQFKRVKWDEDKA
jgi:hypothetical protein